MEKDEPARKPVTKMVPCSLVQRPVCCSASLQDMEFNHADLENVLIDVVFENGFGTVVQAEAPRYIDDEVRSRRRSRSRGASSVASFFSSLFSWKRKKRRKVAFKKNSLRRLLSSWKWDAMQEGTEEGGEDEGDRVVQAQPPL